LRGTSISMKDWGVVRRGRAIGGVLQRSLQKKKGGMGFPLRGWRWVKRHAGARFALLSASVCVCVVGRGWAYGVFMNNVALNDVAFEGARGGRVLCAVHPWRIWGAWHERARRVLVACRRRGRGPVRNFLCAGGGGWKETRWRAFLSLLSASIFGCLYRFLCP
jgi:hypothetical protein